MSEDATLDLEGAPGMDALDKGQEPITPITEGAASDGVAPEQPGHDERPKSPREIAMEAITANRLKDLEAETGKSFQELEEEAADDRETGLSLQQKLRLENRLKVKVDGEEFEVTQDDLVREYQKGRTADRRLEQAAQERKALEAERAEFERTREGGSRKATQSADEESQATPIGDDAGGAKQIYEALVSGDEDAAVEAINKLTKGRQAEAIPADQIAARVRQQIAWEDAQGAFAKDYSDIISDPLLREIASNTLTETLKSSKSYGEAFREAGDRTRAWVRGAGGGSGQAQGGEPPTDPGFADKQSRKERIDTPTAINARAAGKPQDKVESPSEVIAGMRRARGLPT